MRAVWKGLFVETRQRFKKNIIYIFNRGATITSGYIGRRVYIHNGVKFVSVIIRPLMLGLKFGMFSPTKRLGSIIHKAYLEKKKRKSKLK